MGEAKLRIEGLARLLGCSRAHAWRRAEEECWEWEPAESRGRNGKRPREYRLGSLPADVQLKYANQLIERGSARLPGPTGAGTTGSEITVSKTSIEMREAKPAAATLPLFAPPDVSLSEKAALEPALRAEAEQRLEAIAPLLDFRARTNGTRPIVMAGGKKISKLDDLAGWIARQRGLSKSTIWNWYMRYTRDGYAGLADRPRSDAGVSRFAERHPKGAAFLLSKVLGEKLSTAHAYSALLREWKQLEAGAPPHYSTVRNFLANPRYVPETARKLSFLGPHEFHAQGPHILRERPRPMAWWVLDHRRFDVMVRNRLFDFLEPEALYRPWLTLVCDWGSTKMVGFCLAPTPSSNTINSAMRMAVAGHGFPENLYFDNGKDFQKVERQLSTALAGLLNGRVEITNARPYSARSKPIESWFVPWAKRFDREWGPAYCGNKPSECPAENREAQKRHALFRRGKAAESPLPTDHEFIVSAIQWLTEANAAPKDLFGGRAPNEVLDAACPPEKRQSVDHRLLDQLFSERQERVVQPGGSVELDCMTYEPEESSIGALARYEKHRVTILRDPYNLSEAVAYDSETHEFLGELRVQQLVPQSAHGRLSVEHIKAAERRRREYERGAKAYLYAVAAMARAHGWQTEVGYRAERALGSGTDGVAAAAPAAQLVSAPRRERPKLAPAFVSDAVEQDAALFQEIQYEE